MDIYQVLDDLKIQYIEHSHPAFYTCAEADDFYKNVDGGKSKNLFLRGGKGDNFYLILIASDKRLDLKGLARLLGETKLSFASSDELMRYLGLTPGSVSVFGLINDLQKQVIVVVDNGLLQYDRLHYHPNVNTKTLVISKDDLLKFLTWTKNKILFFDL